MWCNACGPTKCANKTSARFINPSRLRSKTGSTSCPRSSSSLLNATLRELSAALAAKKLSSVELTRACLARIARHQELNAFISVDESSAIGAARRADARLVPAATGTDTGGSIRQPAALSGVCGLKPTYGVVSRFGIVAFASSLDQAGPLAKTAADLALLMNAMAGFDERDSTSLERPKE